MDHDELARLSRLARAGDIEARNRIIVANLGLVPGIAEHFRGRGLDMDDLIAEGNFGLFDAIERFDPDRGYRFSTYAYFWIKEAIRDALLGRGRLVRVSGHTMRLVARWRRARRGLAHSLGRQPDPVEVAEVLGLTDEQRTMVLAAMATNSTYSFGIVKESNSDLEAPPEGRQSEGEDWVHDALSRLDAGDREVLVLRYGIGGMGPLRGSELGRRLGVSRQAASDAVRRARERLAAALAG